MGNAAAKLRVAIGPLKREAQMYNVEERAFKHLDKQDKSQVGKAAPKYPSTTQSEEFEYKDLNEKDDNLISRMQKISLSRVDGSEEVKARESKPKLSREEQTHVQSPEYGYTEPDVIPEGKCTLRQALEFISKHHDSDGYSVDQIATDYKLKSQDVQNILDCFVCFKIHVSKQLADQMPHLKQAVEKTKYNQPPRQYAKLTGGMDQRIHKDFME